MPKAVTQITAILTAAFVWIQVIRTSATQKDGIPMSMEANPMKDIVNQWLSC